jgi:hypothetical protein
MHLILIQANVATPDFHVTSTEGQLSGLACNLRATKAAKNSILWLWQSPLIITLPPMSTKRRAEKPSTAHLPQVPTAPEPKSAHRLADSQGMDARAQGVPIPIVHKKQKQIIKYEESETPNPDIASDGTAPGIAAAATAEHSVTGPSIPCNVKEMIRDAVYNCRWWDTALCTEPAG